MQQNISEILKKEDHVNVYRLKKQPNMVYKEYLYTENRDASIKELKELRRKLIAMKTKKEWPEFLIKPTKVGRFYKKKFVAQFPYVEGTSLTKYLSNNNISLDELALFIKKLEDNIYSEEAFVFWDLANTDNIILSNNDTFDFKLIDVDDVQFDGYDCLSISSLIVPEYEPISRISGMQKCKDGNLFNKQLDIRSVYALLYYMINGKDDFIPSRYEHKTLYQYERTLSLFNIPVNSSLYDKSMELISENYENRPIGNSLYELIEDGYELETVGKTPNGYKHQLIKK